MKQTSPLFSIVIPTLNEEGFLSHLLDGLMRQTEPSFEVIICDGKSEDKTVVLAKTYSKHFPLTVFQINKQGPGVQRNKGANKAVGRYIVFLDADVEVPPNFLDAIHGELDRDPADLATCRIEFRSKKLFDRLIRWITNALIGGMVLIRKPSMTGACMIVQNQVFMKLRGFDESVVHSEDLELSRRAGREGYQCRFFRKPFYYYSLRRAESEGRLRLFSKYVYSFGFTLFLGPIRNALFSYPMGGHVHKTHE